MMDTKCALGNWLQYIFEAKFNTDMYKMYTSHMIPDI